MKTQRAVPFLRLLIPFVAGIIAGIWADYLQWGQIVLPGVLLSFPVLYLLSQNRWPYSYRWIFGAVLTLWLAALGYGLTVAHNELHHPRHFSKELNEPQRGLAVVQRMQAQGAGFRLQTNLIAIGHPALYACEGRLLINLRDSTAALQPGDTLAFHQAEIKRLTPPLNPGVFDFSRYWHYRNFHYQLVLGPAQWQLAGISARTNLLQLAERSRTHYVSVLRKYLPTDDEWAVGCALLLGAKDAMTDEVTQAYSRTGAMHALAVSGMHVAIVWLALAWLLYPLKLLGRPGTYASAILLIAGVWAYAIFTGGSPSALRAATMVSFLILGQSFHRRHSPFNTLAASAFVLLCINPYLLMDAGFQLSYLAVAGILAFEKPLYLCWYVTSRWVDYLWRLTCVSVAAQLATFPISLYYFHQFPVYFWLSGWVVVPASTLLLYWGGVLLVFHPVASLAVWVGKGFYAFVWVVNKAVFIISVLPGAVADRAWISPLGVVTLYLAILALAIAVLARKGKWLLWMGFFLVVAAADRCLLFWKAVHQRKVVVYHAPRSTLIDFFDGRKVFSYSTLPPDHPMVQKSAGPYRGINHVGAVIPIENGDSAFQADALYFRQYAVLFYQLTLAIIDSTYRVGETRPVKTCDFVILSGNPMLKIADLLSGMTCRRGIIADASNSYRRVESWKKECREAGISFYDVKNDGAFICELSKNDDP